MPNSDENILKKLTELTEAISGENLKTASKEDVIEYLRLVDELKAMLITEFNDEEK